MGQAEATLGTAVMADPAVEKELRERFLRYVKMDTGSRLAEKATPSTPGQWDLINLLEGELRELGVEDIYKDEHGYLIGRLPASDSAGEAPVIGLMAHVDTSEDSPGKDVHPLIHSPYDGGPLELPAGQVIDPGENPELARYQGQTVITSDGTTLLGADDKAGIAEIMTALHYLMDHPEIPRPALEIIFTPDEETGTGMDLFPLKELKARCCYTMDGGKEGEIENECYFAHKAEVTFRGRVIHPGKARGRLVNAISMAAAFLNMIPRSESPEATDGRYGNYWPHGIEGSMEEARLLIYMRDFDIAESNRRIEALGSFASAVEAAFPGGKVSVETAQQYANMKENLDKDPAVVATVCEAVRRTGLEPDMEIIRGGTDGSRLTAMGISTPNVFAGGHSFHSRTEWIGVPAMVRAAAALTELARLWADGGAEG